MTDMAKVGGFSHEGHWITNPFYSECLRFAVTPAYYGFGIDQTGGGCTAWVRDEEGKCQTWVSGLDADAVEVDDRGWILGFYYLGNDELEPIWHKHVDADGGEVVKVEELDPRDHVAALVRVDDMDSQDFDTALAAIQNELGVTDGGFAGAFFMGREAEWLDATRAARVAIYREYLGGEDVDEGLAEDPHDTRSEELREVESAMAARGEPEKPAKKPVTWTDHLYYCPQCKTGNVRAGQEMIDFDRTQHPNLDEGEVAVTDADVVNCWITCLDCAGYGEEYDLTGEKPEADAKPWRVFYRTLAAVPNRWEVAEWDDGSPARFATKDEALKFGSEWCEEITERHESLVSDSFPLRVKPADDFLPGSRSTSGAIYGAGDMAMILDLVTEATAKLETVSEVLVGRDTHPLYEVGGQTIDPARFHVASVTESILAQLAGLDRYLGTLRDLTMIEESGQSRPTSQEIK